MPATRFFNRLFAVVAVLLFAISAYAQSSNREAVRWFNTAVKERNDYKAIEAYEKAIALDPDFAEALINLGMRYKLIGDLDRAETYLQKALATGNDKIAAELAFKIRFEIANIYLRKDNLPAYEAQIEAARQTTNDPDLLATLSFEHGRFLYQKKRYREAILELQMGLRTNPKNHHYFENLIALAETARQTENLYLRAVSEEDDGKLESALTIYREIAALDSTFRGIQEKISHLEGKIETTKSAQNLNALYSQAIEFEKKGQLEAAIARYESLLQQSPNFRDAGLRLEKARDNVLAHQRRAQLDRKYAEGSRALRDDNLTRAILLFEEIVATDPRFKDAKKLLDNARNRIESKTAEAVVGRYYQDGLADLLAGEYLSALNAFKKVYDLDPEYDDIADKIALAEAKLMEEATVAEQNHAQLIRNTAVADSLFKIAEMLIAQQNWQQARALLEQINQLTPHDEVVIAQLAEINARLGALPAAQKPSASSYGQVILVAGGVFTALIVLPLAGAFFFVPTVRMRYYLMVGDIMRAAAIIEKQLEQNPGRLKLYPVLANIYLLQKRNDSQAIKVYRTVAQLNLATHNKQAIQAMLANHYMVDSGEADPDTIRFLEQQLRDELRQRKS